MFCTFIAIKLSFLLFNKVWWKWKWHEVNFLVHNYSTWFIWGEAYIPAAKITECLFFIKTHQLKRSLHLAQNVHCVQSSLKNRPWRHLEWQQTKLWGRWGFASTKRHVLQLAPVTSSLSPLVYLPKCTETWLFVTFNTSQVLVTFSLHIVTRNLSLLPYIHCVPKNVPLCDCLYLR